MAGFSKVYFVGSTGGFMGADGLARPFFQIMVGDSDRQWLEPVYDETSRKNSQEALGELQRATDSAMGDDVGLIPQPIGKVTTIIPLGPDDPVSILDAVIAFFPAFFRNCRSLSKVEKKLKDVTKLDFSLGTGIPAEWNDLRSEALPRFRELAIFEANLVPVDLTKIDGHSKWSGSV